MAGLDLTGRTADRHRRLARHRAGDRPGHRRGRRQRRPHRPVAGGGRRGRGPGRAAPRSASARTPSTKRPRSAASTSTLERFGSLDILVNNAGTNPAFGPVIDQDHARFAKTFDVNLWAPILWTGLATRAWMGEHGGAVVNTASVGGMAFEANIGVVQRLEGRADPSHQATGPGTLAEGPGQRGGAGRGAHAAGRGAVEGARADRRRPRRRSGGSVSPPTSPPRSPSSSPTPRAGSPARPW